MARITMAICVVLCLAGSEPARAADSATNLRRTAIVDAVEKTKDAVVYISTTRTVTARINPYGNDPFFAPFGRNAQQRIGSLGSGFIVHRDGYVVTNFHVVNGARQIKVELLDGRKLPADLISSDPDADLAILKVQHDAPLPTLELGDSSDLMIGEPVIAVGNPLGFSHSVSSGILSALHRDLTGDNGAKMLTDVIQTDTAINPGNSGGPLLNIYGQVIGINTAIRSDAQNIGFAIQVNRLRDLIPDLMSPEHVNRAEIPIKLTEVRQLSEPATIMTTVRVEGTNEIVESIAGQHPQNIIDAYAILLQTKPGEQFELVTEKGKQQIKVAEVPIPDIVVQAKKRLGLTVEDMTPMQAGKLGIDQETGILITGVEKKSIGDAASLQVNDIIVQIGRYRVTNLKDLIVLLQYMPKKGKVFVGIVRPGEVQMGRTVFDFGGE